MPHYEPNRALNRHQLETIAWQVTPADYRGGSGSRRSVLMNSPEGTTLVPLSELTDNQLRKYIGPKSLEEGGDMKKNATNRYLDLQKQGFMRVGQKRRGSSPAKPEREHRFRSYPEASSGDYVIVPAHGAFLVDRVESNGRTFEIADEDTLTEAISAARLDAQRRDYTSGIIFELRGDGLHQIGHINAQHELPGHRANARRPASAHSARDRKPGMPDEGGLHQDEQLLKQFVEMSAESMEIDNWEDADCTSEVIDEARRYDEALWRALTKITFDFPKRGITAHDLWDANAPYLVLMTLRGEGVGIWDGDWDDFYSRAEIDRITKILEKDLGGDRGFASSSGSGSLENVFMNAACETTGGCDDYSKNARRGGAADEVAARELSLYIENEYSLVGAPNSQGKAIEKNLLQKIRNGSFDLELSEKSWMHLMESGAKKYAKEYASPGDWSKIFTKPTRELVAHEFAVSFWEEHKPR